MAIVGAGDGIRLISRSNQKSNRLTACLGGLSKVRDGRSKSGAKGHIAGRQSFRPKLF